MENIKTTKPSRKVPSADAIERRSRLIRETAYLIAERSGFPVGRELDHWLEAERTIDGNSSISRKKNVKKAAKPN